MVHSKHLVLDDTGALADAASAERKVQPYWLRRGRRGDGHLSQRRQCPRDATSVVPVETERMR